MLKSCGESASQSKNGRQREGVAGPEGDLLAPVRVEQPFAVEAHDLADEPAERGVRACLDRREHGAEELRQVVFP